MILNKLTTFVIVILFDLVFIRCYIKNLNLYKSRFLLLSILLLTIILISGCFGGEVKDEKFTSVHGYEITFNSTFYQSYTDIENSDLYLESLNVVVSVVREDFRVVSDAWYNPYVMTTDQYASMLIDTLYDRGILVNYYDDNYDENIEIFDYTYYAEGETFYYYTIVNKGTDAFWTTQFICINNDKIDYLEDIAKWSNTIVIP